MPRLLLAISLFFFSVTAAQADLASAIKALEGDDYVAALSELHPLAEAGDAEAQYRLGLMYDAGSGVETDPGMALELFLKAANQGHAEAQRVVGIYYEEGKGVRQSYTDAVEWYARSAKQGNDKAQRNLGGL